MNTAHPFHRIAAPFQIIRIWMNISLDDKFYFETSHFPTLFENLYVLRVIYHKDWRRRHEHMAAVSVRNLVAQN